MPSVTPIPARLPLFAEPTGRPGDWWEPIPISAAAVAAQLGTEPHRRRLRIDLLSALLLERALVVRDISDCGILAARARAALDAAREAEATSGPGRLHTSYVRMLRGGERDYERETETQLARRDLVLPVRLHDIARTINLQEIWKGESVDQAIAWEIAAATSGQFMSEWALRALLAAFRPQPALA